MYSSSEWLDCEILGCSIAIDLDVMDECQA